MNNNIFKDIIKIAYNFDDENDEVCELCEQPIGDFNDCNGIYEGKYCEDCFREAQESRLG